MCPKWRFIALSVGRCFQQSTSPAKAECPSCRHAEILVVSAGGLNYSDDSEVSSLKPRGRETLNLILVVPRSSSIDVDKALVDARPDMLSGPPETESTQLTAATHYG
jgi:hypothetical protein